MTGKAAEYIQTVEIPGETVGMFDAPCVNQARKNPEQLVTDYPGS